MKRDDVCKYREHSSRNIHFYFAVVSNLPVNAILQIISAILVDMRPFHGSLLALPASHYATQVSAVHSAPLENTVPSLPPLGPPLHGSSESPSLSAQNFSYLPSLPTKHSFAIPFPQETIFCQGPTK